MVRIREVKVNGNNGTCGQQEWKAAFRYPANQSGLSLHRVRVIDRRCSLLDAPVHPTLVYGVPWGEPRLFPTLVHSVLVSVSPFNDHDPRAIRIIRQEQVILSGR